MSVPVHAHGREWTVADLDDTPEDGARYEIVDGSLVVSPAPRYNHEWISALLRQRIFPQVPAGHLVVGPAGVAYRRSYRIPDLVVVPRDLALRKVDNADPADVLLAIEVVSPTSLTTDRITKPAEYAAAGIRAYWRVETDPEISLTAYLLRSGDTYTELGTWREGDTAVIDEPFPVRIEIAALRP